MNKKISTTEDALLTYINYYKRINANDMIKFFGIAEDQKRSFVHQIWRKTFRDRGLKHKGYNVKS